MTCWTMRKQSGFSLIELVMVIVILGVLSAIAIPKYVDLGDTATDAAKQGMVAAANSAFVISIAEPLIGNFPTVTMLANNLQGASIIIGEANEGKGIRVVISGANYLIRTYTESTCTTATADNTDTVQCVGDIT